MPLRGVTPNEDPRAVAADAELKRVARPKSAALYREAFKDADEALDFIGTVLEASTEYAIIGLDLEGKILLWNLGAHRMYGYEPSNVIGQPVSILHTDADVDASLQEMMEGALRDGKWEATAQRVRDDGVQFPARVVLTPCRDTDGQPTGFLLISSDVSQDGRLTETLEVTHYYARSLFESNIDALVATDPLGVVTDVNEPMLVLTGRTREELVGVAFKNCFTDSERAAEGIELALQEGTLTNYELTARAKDGRTTTVDYNATTFVGPDGELRGVLAAARDITARKNADERFRDLLECAPDAVVIVDERGKIVLVNEQTEKLFGYGRDELIEKEVEVLVPARFRRDHLGHRERYSQEPVVRPMGVGLDLYAIRADGTEFPIEISLSPIHTEDGTLISSTIRDVTERKRVERELREINVQLAAADEAKDRFLAGMSHELRTPLNAILGFTGTMLMGLAGPLTDDQRKQLETVATNGKHLLSIINDLLDVARIESGNVAVHLEPVACQSVLDEVMSGLRSLAEGKGLSLEVTTPHEELITCTDRRALTQILINLANNAIKFTEKGAVHLVLDRMNNGGGRCIRFSVVDSGIGIGRENQEKLFEAFEQAEPVAGTRYEGTGLGLYISLRLASLIEGKISFESEPGKGTSFFLILPELPR